ncbi:MAG: hypothetical protein ACKVU4_13975 [Phycisphaerales bacterium]
MPTITITDVRKTTSEANEALETFVSGGAAGNPRAPRGINPETVSLFLQPRIKPDSGPNLYARALDLIRFYERPDVVPGMLLALNTLEADTRGITRSAYAIQAAADFLTGSSLEKASDYFEKVLVPKVSDPSEYALMLETAEVLAPKGRPVEAVAARVRADVAAADRDQRRNEASFRRYQTVAAVERNQVKAARDKAPRKAALAAAAPGARRDELVQVYLGRSPLSDEYTEVWAARLLRLEAMAGADGPVRAAFAKAIDLLIAEMPPEKAGFWIVRAAQAIIYLKGALSPAHAQFFEKAVGGGLNFLWDDPEPDPLEVPVGR